MCENAATALRQRERHTVRHHQADGGEPGLRALYLRRHPRLQGPAENRRRLQNRLAHPLQRSVKRGRRAERAVSRQSEYRR